MKIVRGEFAVCSAGKRSVVVSTVNKEHNLSKSPSEQLRSTAEAVGKKRRRRKSQKVLQLVYAPFVCHLSHSFPNKSFYSFPRGVVEIKNCCVKDPAAAADPARQQTKHNKTRLSEPNWEHVGMTKPQLLCE